MDRGGNLDSSANWIATCVIGKSSGNRIESINMLGANVPNDRPLKMAMPGDCELVRLDMRVAGGIGRDPASLIVSGLELTQAATAK